MHPSDPLKKHFPRLKKEQEAGLKKLGIHTVEDLLFYLPARYENAALPLSITSLPNTGDVTIFGTIKKIGTRKTWKSRKAVAEGMVEDGTGSLKVMWFSQPYLAKMLHVGKTVKLSGRLAGTGEKRYLANPKIEYANELPIDTHDSLFKDDEGNEMLHALYPETKGVTSLWIAHAVRRILSAHAHEQIEDPLPENIRKRYNLPGIQSALVWVHTPRRKEDADSARKRLAFDEVFTIQLGMEQRRKEAQDAESFSITVDNGAVADFMQSFPFEPTGAQKRAIDGILHDFKKPHPMMRLLEGDVGSGKTAVAATAAYTVAMSLPKGRAFGNLQVAYMVPTEILAKQHFASFIEYFKDHQVKIGLVTGSGCYKFPSKVKREIATKISRAQLSKWVEQGEIPIVIGTHALIQKSLRFKHLALAIIDEQHRFGKVQRQKLAQKDAAVPHLLSMTATPIPRTLALTIYGDLDLTLLDELPAGRKPVITNIIKPDERDVMYKKLHEELARGRQAYVICPRIDEPDPTKELALQAKSVKAEAARLQKDVFPEYNIDILHSKMTPDEKEKVMNRFEKGTTHILVATSVVEVGVNVPNATCIVIEGAERFGLAQLHQLRGRVLRSSHQAHCFLYAERWSEQTKNRLKALVSAKNGFELAEHDLALRGAGELYGARQWGLSDVGMEAIKNIKMVEAARNEAQKLITEDPTLSRYPVLRARVLKKDAELHRE